MTGGGTMAEEGAVCSTKAAPSKAGETDFCLCVSSVGR